MTNTFRRKPHQITETVRDYRDCKRLQGSGGKRSSGPLSPGESLFPGTRSSPLDAYERDGTPHCEHCGQMERRDPHLSSTGPALWGLSQ